MKKVCKHCKRRHYRQKQLNQCRIDSRRVQLRIFQQRVSAARSKLSFGGSNRSYLSETAENSAFQQEFSDHLTLRRKQVERIQVDCKNWKRFLFDEEEDVKRSRVDNYIFTLQRIYAELQDQKQKFEQNLHKRNVRAVRKGYTNYKQTGAKQLKERFSCLVAHDSRMLWFYDPQFLKQNASRLGLSFGETPEEKHQRQLYQKMSKQDGQMYERLLKERKTLERSMSKSLMTVKKKYHQTSGFVPLHIIAESDKISLQYSSIDKKITELESQFEKNINQIVDQIEEQAEVSDIELIIEEPVRILTEEEKDLLEIRENGLAKTNLNLAEETEQLDQRIDLFERNHHLYSLQKKKDWYFAEIRAMEKKIRVIKNKTKEILQKWRTENREFLKTLQPAAFDLAHDFFPSELDEEIQENLCERPKIKRIIQKSSKIALSSNRPYLNMHFNLHKKKIRI